MKPTPQRMEFYPYGRYRPTWLARYRWGFKALDLIDRMGFHRHRHEPIVKTIVMTGMKQWQNEAGDGIEMSVEFRVIPEGENCG